LHFLLLALAIGADAAQATASGQRRKPLPAADCINTDRIDEGYVVDPRTAVVRTGPKRYRCGHGTRVRTWARFRPA